MKITDPLICDRCPFLPRKWWPGRKPCPKTYAAIKKGMTLPDDCALLFEHALAAGRGEDAHSV